MVTTKVYRERIYFQTFLHMQNLRAFNVFYIPRVTDWGYCPLSVYYAIVFKVVIFELVCNLCLDDMPNVDYLVTYCEILFNCDNI